MRRQQTVWWMVIAGLSAVLWVLGVAWNRHGSAYRVWQAEAQQPPTSLPKYNPPLRGAPLSRVGSGTRAPGEAVPVLSVFAPRDHAGRTTQEQPRLYWYLSQTTTSPLLITLAERRGIKPLLEVQLAPPVAAGVHRLQVADYDVRLSPNVLYQWAITLILDPDNPSRNLVEVGAIEYVSPSDALRARLAPASKQDTAAVYAAEGIWYDAVTTLSELIAAAPETTLRQQRATLLEQVGLMEAATYDRQ